MYRLARSLKVSLALLFALVSPSIWAHLQYNMTPGVTPVSRDIYHLHMTIFIICVVIGVGVFGVMFYSLFKHRKSKGAVASEFHEHPMLEIVWSVIPFLILVAMAIPATMVLIRMNDSREAALNIKITGYQWKWRYEYLDQGIDFFSNLSTPLDQIYKGKKRGEHYLLEVDNEVVVPTHKKIRFLVTANDVIHSWWVPALGIKRDGIPGFIQEGWAIIDKPGVYRGQCAELCGVNHGFMPIVVKAVPEEEFEAWIAQKKQGKAAAAAAGAKVYTKDELMTKGKAVYEKVCAACHQANGEGLQPAFPALKGSSVAVGPKDRHIHIVVHGVEGTSMQAFGPQLNDLELAAVITYERNAWGNNTNDMVQPADIKKQR